MAVEDVVKRITWLGHDGFRIDGPPVIYFDPWKLKRFIPADIILVSHDHFDHFSKEDVAQLTKSDTVVVGPPEVTSQVTGNARALKPGDRIEIKGVAIEAVPAYNVNKFRAPGQPFHPKGDAKLGFVITIDGVRVYHAGDTDLVPEMSGIKADVALLPVSGTYVMTVDEAVDATKRIGPKVAIPMHYGEIVGSAEDAERFQREAPVEVRILAPEQVA